MSLISDLISEDYFSPDLRNLGYYSLSSEEAQEKEVLRVAKRIASGRGIMFPRMEYLYFSPSAKDFIYRVSGRPFKWSPGADFVKEFFEAFTELFKWNFKKKTLVLNYTGALKSKAELTEKIKHRRFVRGTLGVSSVLGEEFYPHLRSQYLDAYKVTAAPRNQGDPMIDLKVALHPRIVDLSYGIDFDLNSFNAAPNLQVVSDSQLESYVKSLNSHCPALLKQGYIEIYSKVYTYDHSDQPRVEVFFYSPPKDCLIYIESSTKGGLSFRAFRENRMLYSLSNKSRGFISEEGMKDLDYFLSRSITSTAGMVI